MNEAMKLRDAAEKVVELCSERPLSLGKWFIDMSEACESLREALVKPCCGNFTQCHEVCMPRAAADEREACAKVCAEDNAQAMDFTGGTFVGGYFAKKITERNKL